MGYIDKMCLRNIKALKNTNNVFTRRHKYTHVVIKYMMKEEAKLWQPSQRLQIKQHFSSTTSTRILSSHPTCAVCWSSSCLLTVLPFFAEGDEVTDVDMNKQVAIPRKNFPRYHSTG